MLDGYHRRGDAAGNQLRDRLLVEVFLPALQVRHHAGLRRCDRPDRSPVRQGPGGPGRNLAGSPEQGEVVVEIALQARRLRKRYRKEGAGFDALGPVSLDVRKGEILAVLGPTGCGKTTLLRLIAGLEKPDGGEIAIPPSPSGEGPSVALVFQQGALFPWMTTLRNVEFPLKARRASSGNRRKRAMEVLEMVGISEFAHSYPYQLSGGMQQRAALARSLVYDPGLLLMDEPFGSLDAKTSQHLQEKTAEIQRRTGATIVFVTHDIEEAVFLGHRVLVLGHRPGRIEREEAIDLNHPRDRLSEGFTRWLLSLRSTFERLV
ncbi:ATP-binding cassette domain-containing protein [Candidatus Fermentibacteria bacterium]|nr:ATP-binding cassette domain-containing protein [Candidatus Fermentibacteria bacterium]